MMRSQQKKIEEQQAILENLRQRLEKVEKSVERSQTTSNSWVPCIHDINLKNKEGLAVRNVSDNLSVKVDTNETVNDSDCHVLS